MRAVKCLWMLFGKAWALAFVFAGGGLLALTLLPALDVIYGPEQARTQRIIHRAFRFYLMMLTTFRFLYLDIEGREKLTDYAGKIVIANHPSLLDVVILMALLPRVQCVVKHELWTHKLLGGMMQRAGYIRNDLEAEAMVEACKSSLADGRCLIIFPEGTRTPIGAQPKFQRGFANLAFMAQIPIQKVLITCTPPFLYKGEPWWHVPSEISQFQVVIGETLDAESYLRYGQRGIAVRKITESLEDDYAEQLALRRPGTGT